MATDLKSYLSSSQQAPDGIAYELFKLQPDDTYAQRFPVVNTGEAPLNVQVVNPTTLQSVAIQQQPTDAPIRVTLEMPLYSVATPTMDGLLSSTDKIKLNSLSTAVATTTANGLMSSSDKSKLETVANTYKVGTGGVAYVGDGAYGSEIGWRSLNGLHFNYNAATNVASNPWVKIGNFPANEGAVVLEVLTITDYNYEGFNTAEVCVKRFNPGNGSMSANIKPTSENDSGIYLGFNTNGDVFLKCTVLWGSVAYYRIKFVNTGFVPQTPTVFTGTVTHEIGSPAGFPKTKRVSPA